VESAVVTVSAVATGERYLIYDIGMHDGKDSAYYLREGYRVVAVDANPYFVRAAESAFRDDIASGRLTVLNVGIAESAGVAKFWICDDHSDWSSFDRAFASREGARHHPINVTLRPFRDLLDEYGLPHYCKVDIEGSDMACVDAMSSDYRPAFVSVELGFRESLDRLAALGYDRFKVIEQSRLAAASRLFYRAKSLFPQRRIQGKIERVNYVLCGCRQDHGWHFAMGSSGPLPEKTRGRWLSYPAARRLIRFLEERHDSGVIGLDEWFDLHATDQRALAATRSG
jgi:FkbM family methyltransferase